VTAAFEQWVQAVFDHPPKEPEWYWDEDFDSLWDSVGLSDAVTVTYLTRLFLEPEPEAVLSCAGCTGHLVSDWRGITG